MHIIGTVKLILVTAGLINNSEAREGTTVPKEANHTWLCVLSLQSTPKYVYYVKVTSLRQQWMHWVENTQYATVHEGKTQRRDEFLMGQLWPWSEGNQEMSQHRIEIRRHQEYKHLFGWWGWSYLLSWTGNWGSLSASDVQTVTRIPLQASFEIND